MVNYIAKEASTVLALLLHGTRVCRADAGHHKPAWLAVTPALRHMLVLQSVIQSEFSVFLIERRARFRGMSFIYADEHFSSSG